jgi:metallo-beta-lactamase family protein
MAKITFHGACGTVTGSRFQLEIDGKNVLVDCGLFQGTKENRLRNWQDFPLPPSTFDHVFITHSHIDHCGYLPRFVKQGFSGKVIASRSTSDLCEVVLRDSAHLQEEDAKWANKKGFSKHSPALPLYDADDVEKTIPLFRSVYYGENYHLSPDTRVKFRDSGHILGASLIDFKTKKGDSTRKILFSGDLGRPEIPVLNDPDQVYNVDYLILESTYGNRSHSDTSAREDLQRVINESNQRGGVLVIPAFSVSRTQTLLYLIRELEEEDKIPVLPVYVDSPMAIEALNIFENHISDFDLGARVQKIMGKDIFRTHDLHICRSKEESISINNVKSHAIIISASGMVTGGRILHHMARILPDPKNTVLLIGYQAEGTRGRTLQEKKETVTIHGKKVPVSAQIEDIDGFSGHADYNEMLAWLMPFNKAPKKVFIVHGNEEASAEMARKIKDKYGWNVVIPATGDSFELD